MIKAAGDNNDLDFAKTVYEDARKARQADAVTYASMIKAAGDNNDLAFAKQIFKDIPSMIKKNDKDYREILHGYLDVLYKDSDKSEAQKVYQTNQLLLKNEAVRHSRLRSSLDKPNAIDLHGFSYGSSRLLLEDLLADMIEKNDNLECSIIHGRGLHSKHEEPVVKKAVWDAYENIRITYQDSNKVFGLKEHKYNTGITSIYIHIPTLIESSKRKAPVLSIRYNKKQKRHTLPVININVNVLHTSPCESPYVQHKYKSQKPQKGGVQQYKAYEQSLSGGYNHNFWRDKEHNNRWTDPTLPDSPLRKWRQSRAKH